MHKYTIKTNEEVLEWFGNIYDTEMYSRETMKRVP